MTAASRISPAVVAFVREHVTSIELLEVLLLLRAGRAWTGEALAVELRLRPRSVEARCATLMTAGLAVATADGMRFATESPLAAVDELAVAYRTHRVSVIELIFSGRST